MKINVISFRDITMMILTVEYLVKEVMRINLRVINRQLDAALK